MKESGLEKKVMEPFESVEQMRETMTGSVLQTYIDSNHALDVDSMDTRQTMLAGSTQPDSKVLPETSMAFKVNTLDSDLICSRVSIEDASPTMILAVHHNEENPADKLRMILLEISEEDKDNHELIDSLFSSLNDVYGMVDGPIRLGGWFNNHGHGLSIVLNDLDNDDDYD
eukprot:gnl/MRDRNA2_/MRDRNA2_79219_c0_seq1.p1 gnl/MRDRNA2_/MRDRNA2_79219_c0~~gnl/MRDRNA2_/MRDRNA2_79219_c0_seq1.p1  ORF type:complete len:171 (+),score=35.96 gnl/MRDRNA2_/MRDRNA2_79219_c0_seq1:175-687(+)